MGSRAHLFGRYTQVPLWTPIKHAEVFNPTPPFLMLLSFIPLRLQVLTAIWQCQAVATDAMGSKGHSFIPHIKQVLIFHSLQKNIKREGEFWAPCQMPHKMLLGIRGKWELERNTKKRIFKAVYLLSFHITLLVLTTRDPVKLLYKKQEKN